MNKLNLIVLMIATFVVAFWFTAARAAPIIIDFAESGGTANSVESNEVTTTTASVSGLPDCSATVGAPCVSAKMNGGPGLRNGQEDPAEVDLNLLPNTFATLGTGQTPTNVSGYLMDRGGKTVSDLVGLTITNMAGLQTVAIKFTSDSTTSKLPSIPGGFVFSGAVEGMPTTKDHVDLSGQFFTGPADRIFDQRPYALPGRRGDWMITAFSDVDQNEIPEPGSLMVFGCSLIGLALVAACRALARNATGAANCPMGPG